MRPRKKILIYHPDEETGQLLRYAMQNTLPAFVYLAASQKAFDLPGENIEVTVLWKGGLIEIRSLVAETFRSILATTSNLELMEAVRVGMMRKRGPNKGEKLTAREKRQVATVEKSMENVARMMDIVEGKKKRFAA
jgi:hypothetical protein